MKYLTVVIAVLGVSSVTAQETGPARSLPPGPQPAPEEEVASTFEAAASELFRSWVAADWPEVLHAANLGRRGTPTSACSVPDFMWYYTFIDCQGPAPTEYSIDVKKTDSILTPYLGTITAPFNLTCLTHNVVPNKAWTQKNYEAMASSCLGKPYEECVKAGKDAPKLSGSACTGGPGTTLSFVDKVTLTYKWSHGKWEFQKRDVPAPRYSATKQ